MLKLFSYCTEAELSWLITFARAEDVELNVAVYVQSVATPTRATFLVFGQPTVLPIVEERLTPAPLPLVCPSICLPSNDLVDKDPQNPASLFTSKVSSRFSIAA
jgi:hypothetical protein